MAIEFTGERYVPELLSAKISYEHWHRYMFAKRFCKGRKVLDIACGEGYGTAYLATVANHVTGVDISPDVILHAKEKYDLSNVLFIQSDVAQLDFKEGEFDTIISFETLEHLNTPDQERFLKATVQLLSGNGFFIVSTPNKKVYSDQANYVNPYHLSEFYRADFEMFLLNYFKGVVIFGQQVMAGSIISQDSNDIFNIDQLHVEENGFVPTAREKKTDMHMEYLIAVCSQSALPVMPGSILLDNDNTLLSSS